MLRVLFDKTFIPRKFPPFEQSLEIVQKYSNGQASCKYSRATDVTSRFLIIVKVARRFQYSRDLVRDNGEYDSFTINLHLAAGISEKSFQFQISAGRPDLSATSSCVPERVDHTRGLAINESDTARHQKDK